MNVDVSNKEPKRIDKLYHKDLSSLKSYKYEQLKNLRRRAISLTSSSEIFSSEDCLRENLSKSANISDNEEIVGSKSSSLLQFCGINASATDIFVMSGRALEKVEDMAKYLWRIVPGISFEKSEEIARIVWELGFDKAENMAKCIWEAVPDLSFDKAEEIGSHIWGCIPSSVRLKTKEFANQAWMTGKAVIYHSHLPSWLKDNDYLLKGHRPPLNSFLDCFRSIFRIHTETGNIWTHLIGSFAFLILMLYFISRPDYEVNLETKIVFSAYFTGVILCMCFSWLFHTLYCHSERVGRFFGKLDYVGIALLIVGSFVPWLYFCFYCDNSPRIVYLVCIIVLGLLSIVVSMWDKFGEPQYRKLRAGVFVALGLSGVIPAAHYILHNGFYNAWFNAGMGWLFLMAFLYIFGATIYAYRVPECLWPGKFDILFSSHQIFHVFVVAAAFVHFQGILLVANNPLLMATCNMASS